MVKSPIRPIQAHVSKTKKPMGDYYGVGVKNPIGKMKGSLIDAKPLSAKKLGLPPKKLA